MTTQKKRTITNHETSRYSLNEIIVEGIQDVKGKNVRIFDLTALAEKPTEYFIFCEGDSTTQVRAIAHSVKKLVEEELNEKPTQVEGLRESTWILMDYFDTVVHVFHPQAREYYQVEELWSDAVINDIKDID